jgi:hypothetical protein
MLLLAGCNSAWIDARERSARANVTPTNYKADIVAMMRTYLNDPRNVRDAFVSEPTMRAIEGTDRYTVCLRYNPRKSNGQYAGSKDSLIVFRDGRLDRIVDNARAQCKDVTYQPFPALETMSR